MDIEKRLNFIGELDKLKTVLRVNLLTDASRRENTAEHSWHLAMMVITFHDYAKDPIDLSRALKMALVHDIVEIDAGDTYAFDDEGLKDKDAREQAAAERIFSLAPEKLGHELKQIWHDYEALDCPESHLVRALDRLNPFLQHFQNGGVTWKKKKMSRSLMMSRLDDIPRLCPKLAPAFLKRVEIAVKNGWISPD